MAENNIISLDIQKAMTLDVLKYIISICKKNNIHLYAAYGTLLGAVRHKGYIPWDDDVDIMMPREDYDRFVKLVISDDNKRYKIITHDINSKYPFTFSKVYDAETVVKEKDVTVRYSGLYGIYVDVFPMEHISNTKLTKKIKRNLYYIHNLIGLKITKRRDARSIFRTILIDYLQVLSKLVPLNTLIDLVYKQINRINDQVSSKYLDILTLPTYILKQPMESEWFSQSIDICFEDITIPCPIKYDEVLKHIYGDYLELPPENERVLKHGLDIRFKYN